MDRRYLPWWEKLAEATPGWLFAVAGLALIALTMLTPAWMDLERLRWQRDVMAEQVEALGKQQDRHAAFLEAIDRHDPVVLEHLAYTQLRYKPSGVEILETAGPDSASISAWLSEPMPQVGRDLPEYCPPDTRLTRLTTGPKRLGLLAVGVICLAVSFWPKSAE